MKCSQTRKMISSYVDGELGLEEKEMFASHVLNCPECKKELEEMESVRRLFASTERFDAPLGFVTRVMARIEGREQDSSSFWGFFTLQPVFIRVVQFAFALVILLIGVFSGNVLIADRTAGRTISVHESFSLDLFQTTPPDSLGGIYANLTGVDHER